MKLPTVHSPTSAPSQSSEPVRAASTSVDRLAQQLRDARAAACRRKAADRVARRLAHWPNSWAIAAATMKKGNSVKQRQIGKVAGVDEAIANRRRSTTRLHHLERAIAEQADGHAAADRRRVRRAPLGRFGARDPVTPA